MFKRTVAALAGTAALALVAALVTVNAAEASQHKAAEVLPHNEAGGSGLLLPLLNPARGRTLFASKGCVVCHAVNGIGGEDAPPFDVKNMSPAMDPFDFMARMWRGAEPMITMQNEELGAQVEFTGQELADIIAFLHNRSEQQKFSKRDIPPLILRMIK